MGKNKIMFSLMILFCGTSLMANNDTSFKIYNNVKLDSNNQFFNLILNNGSNFIPQNSILIVNDQSIKSFGQTADFINYTVKISCFYSQSKPPYSKSDMKLTYNVETGYVNVSGGCYTNNYNWYLVFNQGEREYTVQKVKNN